MEMLTSYFHLSQPVSIGSEVSRVDYDKHAAVSAVFAVGNAGFGEVGVHDVLTVASGWDAIVDVKLDDVIFSCALSEADILSNGAAPFPIPLYSVPNLTSVRARVTLLSSPRPVLAVVLRC